MPVDQNWYLVAAVHWSERMCYLRLKLYNFVWSEHSFPLQYCSYVSRSSRHPHQSIPSLSNTQLIFFFPNLFPIPLFYKFSRNFAANVLFLVSINHTNVSPYSSCRCSPQFLLSTKQKNAADTHLFCIAIDIIIWSTYFPYFSIRSGLVNSPNVFLRYHSKKVSASHHSHLQKNAKQQSVTLQGRTLFFHDPFFLTVMFLIRQKEYIDSCRPP